ncbi:hypothetical protein [Actinokineospora globicatena]|uniref:hypothetical protein n=1 Tax=Actinokineospora globicatena TaxID=103729 RepID=UPI0020A2A65B|nr:hypothetical protein [Actinokineospora globicatena]MCP2302873.1 hypothetical protein [Actinokineospora globicatena]GLW78744.1 hypothetical protein Aglo01_32260 [Actinokineospora globicatena]GLW84588.1 hypothetical protein Aglo02_22280 [Actinokineospora globicatena]
MADDALRRLVDVRPGELRLRQAIVLDWHDGPQEGFLGFADSDSRWHFRSFAHQHNPDGLDDRLYLLSAVPSELVGEFAAVLSEEAESRSPVWVPRWEFSGPDQLEKVEGVLAAAMAQVGHPIAVLESADLVHINRIWPIDVAIEFAAKQQPVGGACVAGC